DYTLIHQIKDEAFEHSKVMDHLRYLTDRYGPRLTASPEFDEAADWVVARLKSWGLANVHKESWGPFGRSWSIKTLCGRDDRAALLAVECDAAGVERTDE